MKTTLRLVFATFLLFLTSCCSLQVSSETAEEADLNKYSSYTLTDTEEGFLANVNPTQKMQLEKAIEQQAQAISTLKNNSGFTGPDVLINYFVVVDTKRDLDTYTNYYGRRRWRYQITEVEVREYTQGTLIVDFIDATTKEVVWHGSTSGVITTNSIELEQKINDAVKAIFEKYRKDRSL